MSLTSKRKAETLPKNVKDGAFRLMKIAAVGRSPKPRAAKQRTHLQINENTPQYFFPKNTEKVTNVNRNTKHGTETKDDTSTRYPETPNEMTKSHNITKKETAPTSDLMFPAGYDSDISVGKLPSKTSTHIDLSDSESEKEEEDTNNQTETVLTEENIELNLQTEAGKSYSTERIEMTADSGSKATIEMDIQGTAPQDSPDQSQLKETPAVSEAEPEGDGTPSTETKNPTNVQDVIDEEDLDKQLHSVVESSGTTQQQAIIPPKTTEVTMVTPAKKNTP